MKEKCYVCCDLKSFYASVECVERGLDPMTTNLVVADERRTDKTICLAVSPSLKDYDIPGRARLFEVVQKVREVNARRQERAPGRRMELDEDTRAELDWRQAILLEHIGEQPEVTITWFQPDEKKAGGAYLTATGRLKKFREVERTLLLADGTEIPLEDVVALESNIFQELIDDLIYKW